MARYTFIMVRNLDDLVKIALSAQTYLVHRVHLGKHTVFFVPFPMLNSGAIYYHATEEWVRGSYILYDKFTGEIKLDDKLGDEGRYVTIPVVEVVKQDIIPNDLLKEEKKKKEKKKRES